MSGVRDIDPLLSENSLHLLLDRFRNYPSPYPLTQLRSDFLALCPSDRNRLNATLDILVEIAVLRRTEEHTEPAYSIVPSDLTMEAVAKSLVLWLDQTRILTDLIAAIQYHSGAKCFLIDTFALPWRLNALRHFMRDVGIFKRRSLTDRHWMIQEAYVGTLLAAVRKWNSAPLNAKQLTRAGLQVTLDIQDKLGSQAEIWVEKRERNRLSDHPLVDQVRRISESDVTAGFDILSFSSGAKLKHDRFLEVKSFSVEVRFFWTANEISVAKDLGENYVLVLVDRAQLSDSAYRPIEIPGPYAYFFESERDEWFRSPSTYEFTRKPKP